MKLIGLVKVKGVRVGMTKEVFVMWTTELGEVGK